MCANQAGVTRQHILQKIMVQKEVGKHETDRVKLNA
jgi:hypothetical protein